MEAKDDLRQHWVSALTLLCLPALWMALVHASYLSTIDIDVLS